MRKAVKVSVLGDMEIINLDAPQGSLSVLQEAVGGYVEAVRLSSVLTMWVHEEGKFAPEPVINVVGNTFFQLTFGKCDVIVGDIALTGGVDAEGETIDLSDNDIDLIMSCAMKGF